MTTTILVMLIVLVSVLLVGGVAINLYLHSRHPLKAFSHEKMPRKHTGRLHDIIFD